MALTLPPASSLLRCICEAEATVAPSSAFLGHPWTQSPLLSGVQPLFLGVSCPPHPQLRMPTVPVSTCLFLNLRPKYQLPGGTSGPVLQAPQTPHAQGHFLPWMGTPASSSPLAMGFACEPVTPHRMGVIIVLASRVVERGQRKVLGTAPGREFSVTSVFEPEEKTPYSTQ